MTLPAPDPQTFAAYAITALALAVNLLFLWMASGVARHKSSGAVNPEDSASYKVPLVEQDPPAVARVLRAHQNAQATILPFLVLGLVYTLGGGTPVTATITFGVFIAARWLHSVTYLAAKQPWRSIAFMVGMATTVALAIEIILQLLAHCH